MRLKRVAAMLLAAFVLCCTAACNKEKVFYIDDFGISITTPAGWTEAKVDNYDLQLENGSKEMNLSVFGYYEVDLAKDMSAEDVFNAQKQDLISKRDNAEQVSGTKYYDTDSASVINERYTAERDGDKFCYDMYLLEFDESDTLAWILFNGRPSYIEKNQEVIDLIINSVKAD